jgi:hypothetical protein
MSCFVVCVQVINALSDALAALHSLAEVLLITGNSKQQPNSDGTAAADGADTAKDADAKDVTSAGTAPAAAAAKPGKKGKVAVYSKAELLAAEAAHHLHTAMQLMPAMQKEKYVGKMGSCR